MALPFRCFVGEDSFEGAHTGRQATWLRGVGALLGWMGLVIDVHWGGLLDLGKGWPTTFRQIAKKLNIYFLAIKTTAYRWGGQRFVSCRQPVFCAPRFISCLSPEGLNGLCDAAEPRGSTPLMMVDLPLLLFFAVVIRME